MTPGSTAATEDYDVRDWPNSRLYSPIMRTAKLPDLKIPRWQDRHLRFQFA